MSYLTAGNQVGREIVLLIHGPGVSVRSWMPQLQGLAGTLQVLALDLPGHGESEPIWKPSADGFADTAHRLLEVLGTGAVWVAGHSLGGAVALALAGADLELRLRAGARAAFGSRQGLGTMARLRWDAEGRHDDDGDIPER